MKQNKIMSVAKFSAITTMLLLFINTLSFSQKIFKISITKNAACDRSFTMTKEKHGDKCFTQGKTL